MSNIKIKKLGTLQLLLIVALIVAFTAVQLTTPVIATQATTQTVGEEVPVKSATTPYPASSMVYLGSFTENKVIPVIIIYDPPGRQSYQEVTVGTTISFGVDIEANMAGVTGGGSFSNSVSVRDQYKTSDLTVDYDMGPGKGDRIVCKKVIFTYDIYEVFEGPGPLYSTISDAIIYSYQHYTAVNLRNVNVNGTGLYSRRDLEYIYNVVVENRTNTPGRYEESIEVSAGGTMTRIVEMSASAGFSFGVDAESETGIPLIPKIKFRYVITISESYLYIVKVYFHDDRSMISTYICADVPIGSGFFSGSDYSVPGWTFWFSDTG